MRSVFRRNIRCHLKPTSHLCMAIDWSDGHLCRDGVNFESSRQKLTVYAPLFVAASPIWRTSPYSSHLTADGRATF